MTRWKGCWRCVISVISKVVVNHLQLVKCLGPGHHRIHHIPKCLKRSLTVARFTLILELRSQVKPVRLTDLIISLYRLVRISLLRQLIEASNKKHRKNILQPSYHS